MYIHLVWSLAHHRLHPRLFMCKIQKTSLMFYNINFSNHLTMCILATYTSKFKTQRNHKRKGREPPEKCGNPRGNGHSHGDSGKGQKMGNFVKNWVFSQNVLQLFYTMFYTF